MFYSVSEAALAHIKTHFGSSEKSGSKFNLDVFPDVDLLILELSNMEPVKSIQQSGGRVAHEYYFPNLAFTGFIGVGLRKDFPYAKIKTEIRNGFVTEFLEVKNLLKTLYVTVIAEMKDNGYHLITIFPGRYTPAFPYQGMSEEERLFAEKFWKAHILLKGGVC